MEQKTIIKWRDALLEKPKIETYEPDDVNGEVCSYWVAGTDGLDISNVQYLPERDEWRIWPPELDCLYEDGMIAFWAYFSEMDLPQPYAKTEDKKPKYTLRQLRGAYGKGFIDGST